MLVQGPEEQARAESAEGLEVHARRSGLVGLSSLHLLACSVPGCDVAIHVSVGLFAQAPTSCCGCCGGYMYTLIPY